MLNLLLRGRPRSVTAQASELRECETGITPFDCPRDKGVDDLDVDGIFGPKAEAAVRGLPAKREPVGRWDCGKQTWTALLRPWVLFSQPG